MRAASSSEGVNRRSTEDAHGHLTRSDAMKRMMIHAAGMVLALSASAWAQQPTAVAIAAGNGRASLTATAVAVGGSGALSVAVATDNGNAIALGVNRNGLTLALSSANASRFGPARATNVGYHVTRDRYVSRRIGRGHAMTGGRRVVRMVGNSGVHQRRDVYRQSQWHRGRSGARIASPARHVEQRRGAARVGGPMRRMTGRR